MRRNGWAGRRSHFALLRCAPAECPGNCGANYTLSTPDVGTSPAAECGCNSLIPAACFTPLTTFPNSAETSGFAGSFGRKPRAVAIGITRSSPKVSCASPNAVTNQRSAGCGAATDRRHPCGGRLASLSPWIEPFGSSMIRRRGGPQRGGGGMDSDAATPASLAKDWRPCSACEGAFRPSWLSSPCPFCVFRIGNLVLATVAPCLKTGILSGK